MPSGIYVRTETTRMKMSKRMLGRPSPRKGATVSDETRKRMSDSAKGRKPWNKGKKGTFKHTEEAKKRIGSASKGNKYATGYKYTKEQRLEMSRIRRGSGHYNWQGGITSINEKVRNSLEYKLWREAVFERDNWTCIWCGARSSKGNPVVLNADHIKSFSQFPELRFAIDNGRTLCKPCHKTTDNYAGKGRIYKSSNQ